MSNLSIYILIFCVYVVLILLNQKFYHLDDKLSLLLEFEKIKTLMDEDAEENIKEIFGDKKINNGGNNNG